MTYEFVSMERHVTGRRLLTLRAKPGPVEKWFGAKEEERQYIGDHTVWWTYPEHRRCSVTMGSMLSEVYEREMCLMAER